MVKKNFGDDRGNRKHPSAPQHHTLVRVAVRMETIFGPPTISSWTQT